MQKGNGKMTKIYNWKEKIDEKELNEVIQILKNNGVNLKKQPFKYTPKSLYKELKDEILALADLGVVDASREKFYPDNYLRRYELVMMLVKYRLAKTNNQLSPVVFPLRGWFFDVAQNTSYAPYVAYAEQQQWISQLITQKDGKKLFSPNKFLTKAEVCALLNLDSSHSFCSNDSIKRGEFAAVLFRGFQRNEDESSL